MNIVGSPKYARTTILLDSVSKTRSFQNCEQKFNALFDEWIAIEHDLLRERGLWGFEQPDPLAKYKLDFIEGPCRMRKRLVLNEDFYKHYPYRLPIENTVDQRLGLSTQRHPSSNDVYLEEKIQPASLVRFQTVC